MSEEKDVLPSDAEDGGLSPKAPPKDRKPPEPRPTDKRTEEDPSEQPS